MIRFTWLTLLLPVLLYAQPDTLWTRMLLGDGQSFLHGVCFNADGDYVAVGTWQFAEWYQFDLQLVKVNPAGVVEWDRHIDRGLGECGWAVRVTSDGGYMVAGFQDFWEVEARSLFLMKADAGGDSVWWHTYSLRGVDVLNHYTAFADVPGGGYGILLGVANDLLLVRTDANGDSLWSRRYAAQYSDNGKDILGLADGFAILGTRSIPDLSFGMMYLIRTDSNGDTLWTRSYGREDSRFNEGISIKRTTDGGYILAGNTVDNQYEHDLWLVRTNADGDTLWTSLIGGTDFQVAGEVQITGDGGFVVCGTDANHWMLCKLDSDGRITWRESVEMNGGHPAELYSVIQTPDRGFVAAGYASEPNIGHALALLVRTGPDPAVESASNPANNPPHTCSLRECYPNPFNPTTTISFSLPNACRVKLSVFDISGRSVKILSDETMQAGEHQITFDGTHLPSGIYFARLESRDFSRTQKLVLLK